MYRGLKFVPKFGSRNRISPSPSIENIHHQSSQSTRSVFHPSVVAVPPSTNRPMGPGPITSMSKPPTPALPPPSTSANTTRSAAKPTTTKSVIKKASSEQVNLLANKMNALKMDSNTSSLSSSTSRRSNLSSAPRGVLVSHQPVIVQSHNRTIIKPANVAAVSATSASRAPPVIASGPRFHTEARALKRQESASSLSGEQSSSTQRAAGTSMMQKKPSGSGLVKSSTFSMGRRSNSQTSLLGSKTTLAALAKARSTNKPPWN